METISLREYARRRVVSDTAVRKAINAGKIVNGRVFENGIPRIIETIANEEWSHYETRKDKPTPATKPVKPAAPHTQAPAVAKNTSQNQLEEPPSNRPPAGSLAAAKLVKEQLNAKLLEVQLKERLGKLVDKDKVYSALFSIGKEIRVTFQAIPDRYIDDILAAGSRNEAHTVLMNAIADALETLADLSKTDIIK